MKYRVRPQEVEAVQWLGEVNCEEVFKFLGLEHPEDELDHSTITMPVYPDGRLEVVEDRGVINDYMECQPGDWFTKNAKGEVRAYANEVFLAEFEPVEEGFRTEVFQNGVQSRVKVTHLATGKQIELHGGHRDAATLEKAAKTHLEGLLKAESEAVEAAGETEEIGGPVEGLKLPWI